MKEENPKVWWKEVKRLCGAKPSADNVTSHIHIEGIEDMSYEELANVINQAFLEPLEEYRVTQPLTKLPVDEDSPELLEVSELRVMKLLASLNPSKACGPDEIPNWLLKEYAELLAFPVSKIINASFEEQILPRVWKFADVSPLPKAKPVEVLKKQPISLRTYLSYTVLVESCRRLRRSGLCQACGASSPGPKLVWCSSKIIYHPSTYSHGSSLVQGNRWKWRNR